MIKLKNILKESVNKSKGFYPNLWYIIGYHTQSFNKWAFWKSAFSSKKGSGVSMKDHSKTLGDVLQSLEDSGWYDIQIIKGSELAVMIQKGETTSPSLF
tara:strand:- start:1 stop:297 length:297 start_codon:yes stop_codon:yes gene_type:complete